VNLAEATIVAMVRRRVGKRVVIRALLYDGPDSLSEVVASVESLATGLLGDQVHRRVLGVAASGILGGATHESVGRDRMIVGKHTSTGRGSRIDTCASSLNLLTGARGAGERRVGQVLGERPLLAEIMD